MRLLMTNVLATAVLLCGATSASAFSIFFDIGGSTITGATTSDTITVNVIADIDVTGLELLGVGVLFDPTALTYNQAGSSAPTYMLYSPASGTLGSAYMIPSQNPPQLWPAPPPGLEEVIVNWQLANVLGDPTQVTGAGLLLATLEFHVNNVANSSIELALNIGGTIVRVNGEDIQGSIGLGAPIVVTPEPTTALLVALGLVGLGVAGRRRA